MIEYLIDLDKTALLAVNGFHDVFQDTLWWLVSAKWTSALLVVALAWILVHKNRRHALLMVSMLVLAFALADQLSSGLIKQLVERLRPTHDPSLESAVHVINGYRGGLYGFVSSHAANSFAASTLVALVMRLRMVSFSLFMWALLQCYSRVYLGVHFPGDIIGGIAVGVVVGVAVYRLLLWIGRRWKVAPRHYVRSDGVVMLSAFAVTVFCIVAAALVQSVL